MSTTDQPTDLFRVMTDKALLKQEVYENTVRAFSLLKEQLSALANSYQHYLHEQGTDRDIPVEFISKGEFEVEFKFGGDVLLFLMHTNVFEFSRQHEVMRTDYIREDSTRSYSGIINIYNFIADSFKYNRINDIGYLIGRVFINRENHYFVEGKRELGFLYNNFGNHIMEHSAAAKLVEAAILYTVNFDLLTPGYDLVKEVSVIEMMNTRDAISLKTGKRLGFRFQADDGA